jgi:hypothetical protein
MSGRSVWGQGDRALDGHAHDPATEMDGPRDTKGRLANFSIDTAILKVLKGLDRVCA